MDGEFTTPDMIRSHHFSAILTALPEVHDWPASQWLQVLRTAAEQANLVPVGELSFSFQPTGVSAIVLLAESHVALHFWPEAGKVTIDIHVCDYQQDNYPKAQALSEVLALAISGQSYAWHYLFLSE